VIYIYRVWVCDVYIYIQGMGGGNSIFDDDGTIPDISNVWSSKGGVKGRRDVMGDDGSGGGGGGMVGGGMDGNTHDIARNTSVSDGCKADYSSTYKDGGDGNVDKYDDGEVCYTCDTPDDDNTLLDAVMQGKGVGAGVGMNIGGRKGGASDGDIWMGVEHSSSSSDNDVCMHSVWCMMHGVWCMVYGVWCMVYGIWLLIYIILYSPIPYFSNHRLRSLERWWIMEVAVITWMV